MHLFSFYFFLFFVFAYLFLMHIDFMHTYTNNSNINEEQLNDSINEQQFELPMIIKPNHHKSFIFWTFAASVVMTSAGLVNFLSLDGVTLSTASAIGGLRASYTFYITIVYFVFAIFLFYFILFFCGSMELLRNCAKKLTVGKT